MHSSATPHLSPPEEEGTPSSERAHMSFPARAANVFVAPRVAFHDVATSPRTTVNWTAPWLLLALATIFSGQMIFQTPSLAGQLDALLREQFQSAIEDGALTQAQATWQYDHFGPGTILFTIAWTLGPPVGALVTLFALALVYQLVGKSAMNAIAPYMKIVEVVGLTFLVKTTETVVTSLLVLATDSLTATPSGAMFFPAVAPEDTLHMVLSKLNPFTFWILYLTSRGLSEVFQRDFPKVFVLITALWSLWTVVTLFAGL